MTDANDNSLGEQARARDAERRDQAGRQRDVAAVGRDEEGSARDEAASIRDEAASAREERLAADQAALSSMARDDRLHARDDRTAGAGDRIDAKHDREEAAADRQAAAEDRYVASVDGLTGLCSRAAGLVELNLDMARARRAGHGMVLAFIDVDDLKGINDTLGHAAGDLLLQRVAHALKAALRPYDLVMRYGGDEFLCAIEGIDVAAARARFARVNRFLAEDGAGGGSVTIGLADLGDQESLPALIAEADADLYRQRATPPDG
ncbi:GGDEF domain-containing protein [Nakamurella panacisegetis]|uniref:GGDEF domain-containing protein n=1 Tax=Nakamurella panacisegetis TaxID=1090615 RepID=UPI0012FDE63A|nr:GGDEF domain-containing protein [Nakamurella panacisegetis]